MKQELIYFKKNYQAVANKIPTDSFYSSVLIHKYRHSIEVLHIGQQLINETPELSDVDNDFKLAAQRALLFHDIGRFQENLERYLAENNNHSIKVVCHKYDHGLIGYEMLKNTPPYNDLRILFAIRYHGKMLEEIYASDMWHEVKHLPQKGEIEKILYLVRDADKLANLYVMKFRNRFRSDLFYRQLSPQDITGPLSPIVQEQFDAKQVILQKDIKTLADRLLMVFSWIFDFNYIRTLQLFFEQHYDDYLFNELATCKVSASELDHIKNILNSKLKNC